MQIRLPGVGSWGSEQAEVACQGAWPEPVIRPAGGATAGDAAGSATQCHARGRRGGWVAGCGGGDGGGSGGVAMAVEVAVTAAATAVAAGLWRRQWWRWRSAAAAKGVGRGGGGGWGGGGGRGRVGVHGRVTQRSGGQGAVRGRRHRADELGVVLDEGEGVVVCGGGALKRMQRRLGGWVDISARTCWDGAAGKWVVEW